MASSSPYLWLFFYLCSYFLILSSSFCNCRILLSAPMEDGFTLDSLRDSLTRQEDSIVFSLIERAKYPYNAPTYTPSYLGDSKSCSILEIFARETEAVQAKAGRYRNPEELPFFPHGLPSSLVPPHNYTQLLYPPAASTNVSKTIWDMYFNDLLPSFTTKGDDGNYGSTSASDMVCLQLLSRRIHYGRFVAEVKFRDAPNDYIPAIRAQDKDALIKSVTSKRVEEMVQRRVKKKAMLFGQDVTLGSKDSLNDTRRVKYKVDPLVVEVSTSKTGKHGHAKCHFVAIDIFNSKKLEDIVPSSHNCDVPHVNRTDYQLIDISEDGFVSLLTENGNTKDDLRLPTDDNLLSQIKDGFAEGKDLVVTVMSAMGEEQICALKDIGPKN